MGKRIILGIAAISILLFAACQSTQQTGTQTQGSLGKVLILYYSWSDAANTENAAKIIQNMTNADMVKVEPSTLFPVLSYDDMLPWVRTQQENNVIPAIKDLGVNPASYDFIFIGTPVWYGNVSMPIQSLLLNTDFGGKPVALFAMAGGNEGPIFDNFARQLRNGNNRAGISLRMRTETEMETKITQWVNSLRGTLSNVVVREVGNVKLHSFMSRSVTPVIIESDRLIIIDFPGDQEENAPLFRNYVASLNKPIERYFISHIHNAHWLGIEKQFPNMQFYSLDADEIKGTEQGAALSITAIPNGSRQNVNGINLEFEADRAIEAWIIKMPDLKAVYVDHLAYAKLHVFFPPLEPRLAHLKRLQSEGYTWFMPGHGAPMQGPDFVDQAEAYFTTILDAVRRYNTVEEAKAAIVARHPDYNPAANLDRFLPAFLSR